MNINERNEKWWEEWWLHDPDAWRGTWREDWRIAGQEGYLLKKRLQYRRFCREICVDDFTQCEFCWDVFDEDKEHPAMAFFEPISKCWICEQCYKDFQQYFKWTIEEPSKDDNETQGSETVH